MTNRLVFVVGNIATGKIELTDKLRSQLILKSQLEWSNAPGPEGKDFYFTNFISDMQRWAFHFLVSKLSYHTQRHNELAKYPISVISDGSIYEYGFIIAPTLKTMGILSELEYQTFLSLFSWVADKLPHPKLMLFLNASVPVLLDRIREEPEKIRNGISENYLQELELHFVQQQDRFNFCPIIKIRSDELNNILNPDFLDFLVDQIDNKLIGAEDIVFPN